MYIVLHHSSLAHIKMWLTFTLGDDIKEGDIRLVGGKYLWEGRVEIFLQGVWGTVSDNGAYSNDASVICRQLGYNTYSKVHYECDKVHM